MKWSSKKAQIGLTEMIMVMIVITILLVIGMVFYFKFSASHTQKIGEKLEEDKAAIAVSTVAQLPEVECTYLGSRTSKACADTIKLLALSEKDDQSNPDFREHRKHYSDLFGYMTIRFEQLYPATTGAECTDTTFQDPNYPETPPATMSCGIWNIYDNPKPNAEPTFRTMPITLYYPSKGMYTFGQLKIFTYD